MAKLIKNNEISWTQPLKDRKKEFKLWKSHSDVAKFCDLKDGTKRLLKIEIKCQDDNNLNIVDWFQITSGKEIYFPKDLQDIVRKIVESSPDSGFTVTILDSRKTNAKLSLEKTFSIATIKTRLGQGRFRQELIDYWGGCSVTEVSLIQILQASHIKPWRVSTDKEKLDLFNGLLLVPNLDSLFDKGFISFDNEGKILVSQDIMEHLDLLGVNYEMRISKIEQKHLPYLEYHRNKIFLKDET